ncbi:MAG: branched-chain amino acid ABC transporter permease [Actinomycetota bacterium]|nr:branched-chain amino acid ABC transporter permease [Actinomycetota bacterium]
MKVEERAQAPEAAAGTGVADRLDRRWLGALVAGVLIIALPPLVLDGVWNDTLSLALLEGLMGLSIVVLTGYVGQLSLMPATFVGVGAFVSADLVSRLQTPFWGSVPLATLAAIPVALLIGMISLRLKGLYLAIMTLVFADVGDQFLFKQSWFAGSGGSVDAPRPKLWSIDFNSDKSYYVLVGLACAVFVVLVWNFSRSRSARACYAVRDNEPTAQAMGVNVAKYKLMAFALSGLIAGFAGALFAHWSGTVSAGGELPAFGLQFSLTIVFFTILGGVRSIAGPFLGAAIWVVLVNRLLNGSPNGQNIAFSIFGILVLLTMLYRPQGLAGLGRNLLDRARTR